MYTECVHEFWLVRRSLVVVFYVKMPMVLDNFRGVQRRRPTAHSNAHLRVVVEMNRYRFSYNTPFSGFSESVRGSCKRSGAITVLLTSIQFTVNVAGQGWRTIE